MTSVLKIETIHSSPAKPSFDQYKPDLSAETGWKIVVSLHQIELHAAFFADSSKPTVPFAITLTCQDKKTTVPVTFEMLNTQTFAMLQDCKVEIVVASDKDVKIRLDIAAFDKSVGFVNVDGA